MERIEDLISEEALASFDQLNAKLAASVSAFDKLIAKSVESNTALGKATGLGQMNQAMKDLAESEKNLKKAQEDLAATQKKMNDLIAEQAKKQQDYARVLDSVGATAGKTSRQMDVVVQSVEEFRSSTQIAAEITKKFSGSMTDNIKHQLTLKSELKQVKDQITAVNDSVKKGQTSYEQASGKLAVLAEKEALLRQSILDVNTYIRQQARETTASEGSITEYTATLDRLQKTYKDLSRAERESAEGQELLASIQKLDPAIKGFNESIGNFQRSVGNYQKANVNFTGALDILKNRFDEVQSQLKKFEGAADQNADVMAALRKEYEMLDRLVNNQSLGFASATAELKNNEKALQELAAAGLQNTEFYQTLLRETAELKDNVTDLKAEIKNLASDTKALDGLVGTAQLLAGTYAVATESAKIFGVESEALAEAQQKSQAIIAVLNGLQAIQNALQKESATMLFLSELRTKALAAGQRLLAFATAGTSTAMKGLRAALISTGLGALLVLIPSVVQAMQEWVGSTDKAREAQKKLNDTLAEVNSSIEKQVDIAKKASSEEVDALKRALSVAQSRGASEEYLLNLKGQIAAAEKRIAKETVESYKATHNQIISMEGDIRELYRQREVAQNQLADSQRENDERGENANRTIIENIDSQIKAIESRLTPTREAYNELLNKQSEEEQVRGEKAMFFIGERQKAMQAERMSLQAQADQFTEVASNEEKSYRDRLAALKQFRATQEAIIKNQRDEKLLDPSLSTNAKLLAEKEANIQLSALKKTNAAQQLELEKEFANRERLARLEILKLAVTDQAKINEAIADDEKKDYGTRLDAAYKAYMDRRGVLELERNEAIANSKLTATERLQVEAQYASQIADLATEYGLKQLELVQANEAKITEAIERENEKRVNIISARQTKEQIALLKARRDKTISEAKFRAEEMKQEAQNNLEDAQEAHRAAFAKYVATKEGTDARYEAEKELNDKLADLYKADAAAKKTNIEASKEMWITAIGEMQEYAGQVMDVIGGALGVSIARQKNALQEQSDQIDINKKREIDAIEASTESEEKKAARIAIVNARAQLQKEAIDRKNRQLDLEKARFEKAAAIMNITLSTAKGIAEALGNPYKIAIATALGAAQLAIAIATPIPAYKHGTKGVPHRGGRALVGDGFRSEMVINPDGSITKTPDRPTVMNLAKGAYVLPSWDQSLAAIEAAALGPVRGGMVLPKNEGEREVVHALQSLERTIKGKKEIHVTRRRNGWSMITSSGNSRTEYYNQNLSDPW